MAIAVAPRADDGGQALLGDAEEGVRVRGGAHGVDGDLHPAVGAVLEAHGHREPRGQLAVHLALRRARADRPPRHEVRRELRRDRVEELAPRGQPELVQLDEQAPRAPEALVDGEAAVEVRVVDEPLPAHRGARLLEVDAHHDAEVGGELARQLGEAPAVVEARRGIVDGAGPHHDDEPVVLAAQDPRDLVAAAARRWPSSPR